MLRNSRRSSLAGSQHSVSSRRSSLSLKDVERIEIAAAQRKKNIAPQLIICILGGAPLLLFIHVYAVNNCDASFLQLIQTLWSKDSILNHGFPSPFCSIAWRIVVFTILVQLIFCLVLPGDVMTVLNSMGEQQHLSMNSFYSCLLVLLLYIFGSALNLYKASIIYLHWMETLSLLTVISIAMVLLLFIRQRKKFENSSDIISDLFFGIELTPVVCSVDLKHFITFRIARTLWPLYAISSLYYNYSLHGKINNDLLACAVLQLIYIGKMHWYEHLQYSQLDAQNRKTGFYCIWSILVLYPALYATPITMLAQRKTVLPVPIRAALFFFGIVSVYITADIDQQRVRFRLASGNMKIWGEDPFFITARYRRTNGEIAANLLLGSGWWGLCRHPNYFSELFTFTCWTILQGTNTFFSCVPLIFLAFFLYVRLTQDELRCLAKYGPYWLQYRNRVKHLLIPSLY